MSQRLSPPPPRAAIPRVVGVRSRPADAAPGSATAEGGESDADPDAGTRWRCLLGGGFAAWALGFVLPGPFVWVLAAIPHEMGHATMGCLLGRPSAPAISLTGHAWTGVGERHSWLVAAVVLGLVAAGVVHRARPWFAAALGGVAAFLLLASCGRLGEVAIAASGHLGELVFAAYCFAVCWSGGRTGTPAERGAGAMAGALLQYRNLHLCWGLMHDAGVRAEYHASGSLGLKNDYLVLAEDLCHCGLGTIAFGMLLLSLAALPVGLWWGARWRAATGGCVPD